jgi:hypothetical protein
MNKMMVLSALTWLRGVRYLAVQPRTISAPALRAPCTASQTHHFERVLYE